MIITPHDTIAVNDSVLDAFRHSREFNYASELVPDHETNYFDRIWQYLRELFDINDAVANSVGQDIPVWLWWCLGTLVITAMGFLIWKYRVKLFAPRDREFSPLEITEDDINEVDLDQLIAEAEKNNDYLMLCRLRYLQTLKAASDAALVTWRRDKTPTQYAMEWLDEDFGIMTNHFLRIRYGHYDADATLAEEMRSRQQALLARIAHRIMGQEPTGQQQEGGDRS